MKKSTTLEQINVLGTFFDHNIPVPDEDDFHTGKKLLALIGMFKGNGSTTLKRLKVNLFLRSLVNN